MDFSEFQRKYAGLSFTPNDVITEKEAFSYNRFWTNGAFTEEQFNNYVRSYPLECRPNNQIRNCSYNGEDFFIYDSRPSFGACVPLSPKAAVLFSTIGTQLNSSAAFDMYQGLRIFGWCILIAIGLSLIFFVLLYILYWAVAWLLLLGSVVALSLFAGFILYNIYH